MKKFIEIAGFPYNDKNLAFWIKLAYLMVWLISIPNGLVYGEAPREYFILICYLAGLLALNLLISRWCYRPWLDVTAMLLMVAPICIVFLTAPIGYFSFFFPILYSVAIIFLVGIANSLPVNIFLLVMILYLCNSSSQAASIRYIYDETIAMRMPYIYICLVLSAYTLMYSIQSYWKINSEHQQQLEARVNGERERLAQMSFKTMTSMLRALDSKIPGKQDHCRQAAEYSKKIAQGLGCAEEDCERVYRAGILHEIGMVGLPDTIIQNEFLSDEEYEEYQTYVEMGYELICHLQVDERIAEAVHYHRERFDGSGFCNGLKGEEIPLAARILGVADYADRQLKKGLTYQEVIDLLWEKTGSWFDPAVAGQMVRILSEEKKETEE